MLAVATTVSGLYTQYRLREVNECQHRYNIAVVETLRTRSILVSADNANNRNLLIELGRRSTPEEDAEAVQQFIKRSEEIDKQRSNSTYPNDEC